MAAIPWPIGQAAPMMLAQHDEGLRPFVAFVFGLGIAVSTFPSSQMIVECAVEMVHVADPIFSLFFCLLWSSKGRRGMPLGGSFPRQQWGGRIVGSSARAARKLAARRREDRSNAPWQPLRLW